MLRRFYGTTRPQILRKMRQIDSMTESDSLSIREAGFEALACMILDAFGTLPDLQEVKVILDAPKFDYDCSEAKTNTGARDVLVSIDRPVRIETRGASVEDWADASTLLSELLPLSKIGAGTLTVTRDLPPVQHFLSAVAENDGAVEYAEYRAAVQGLSFLVDHSFGTFRIVNETTA
jgi:hypothetical protein